MPPEFSFDLLCMKFELFSFQMDLIIDLYVRHLGFNNDNKVRIIIGNNFIYMYSFEG